MPLIVGIDTGGTYTDGVIVDYASRQVLKKAKSLTTKEDLSIGIRNCIEKLCFRDYDKISLVCLSTTLATNAIVEGKGCKTGMIFIGGVPEGKLPTEHWAVLQGKLDIKGRIVKNLEQEEVLNSIENLRGKVSAIAISGYASVRNPEHELYIKRVVKDMLEIPVVCAHELTCSLGFYERSITAALNASLIPIIHEQIQATRLALSKYNIDAPIMIVKGDGSLMQESYAVDRPIETILSGPAASITGGIFLTNQPNAVIIDMGGTTTDIALVQDGIVRINMEGAKVAGWLTRVEAADVCTFGLGGDSYLHIDINGQLRIGPQKVWPLCVIGKNYPELAEELRIYRRKREYSLTSAQEADCFMLTKRRLNQEFCQLDLEIIKSLEERPHSLYFLSCKLDKDISVLELRLQHLIDTGMIARIALTPTDILHADGRYDKWDRDIAEIGVGILADRMNKSASEVVKTVNEFFTHKLIAACLQSLANFEKHEFDFSNNEVASYFIDKASGTGQTGLFKADYSLNKPIIALGAPATTWLKKVSEKLHTQIIIPEHSEVASAIGAASGQIMETVEMLIRPDKNAKKYIVYAPWERISFDTLEVAKEFALSAAKERAASAAQSAGSSSYDIFEANEDIFADTLSHGEEKEYIETRIKVIAVGRPSWKE
jgi:N-methylhydantoinase A/oxoprolinase/acetone carboxylase beta subunit